MNKSLSRATALLLMLIWSGSAPALAVTAKEVIDGDTLVLDTGERVRLIGIDTPEIHDDNNRNAKTAKYEGIKKSAVDLYAIEALSAVRDWVRDQKLVIQMDSVNAATDHKDTYGRLLAYVCRESDKRCLADDLLSDGYALVYRRFSFDRKSEFIKLEKSARAAGKGIWKHRKVSVKPSTKKKMAVL